MTPSFGIALMVLGAEVIACAIAATYFPNPVTTTDVADVHNPKDHHHA